MQVNLSVNLVHNYYAATASQVIREYYFKYSCINLRPEDIKDILAAYDGCAFE